MTCMQIVPPERLGGYEYWTERTAANPKPVLMRRRLPDGQPAVLLDANEDAAFDDGDLGMVNDCSLNSFVWELFAFSLTAAAAAAGALAVCRTAAWFGLQLLLCGAAPP